MRARSGILTLTFAKREKAVSPTKKTFLTLAVVIVLAVLMAVGNIASTAPTFLGVSPAEARTTEVAGTPAHAEATSSAPAEGPVAVVPTPYEMAMRWAPIHYQDTDETDYYADLITNVDYDGDLKTLNNWENLHAGDFGSDHSGHLFHLRAFVYYSVAETCTHWFISFGFFHPRDWTDAIEEENEHENDMEDALAVIEKDGTRFGRLQALFTQAHGPYYAYLPEGTALSAAAGHDEPGFLPMAEYPAGSGDLHPETTQENGGHGLGAKGGIGDFVGQADESGVVYFPSGNSEEPESGDDRDVGYALVPLLGTGGFPSLPDEDGLWERQLDEDQGFRPDTVYFDWGSLRGDEGGGCGVVGGARCTRDSAGPPWGQEAANDGHEGEAVLDPVNFANDRLDGWPDLDELYLENEYISTLEDRGYGEVYEPRAYHGPPLSRKFFERVVGPDGDGDGLHSCDERAMHTDPTNPDTDGDGMSDGDEVAAGTDPLDPNLSPQAIDDVYSTLAGEQLSVSPPGVLANDSDPDGDALTAARASGPTAGILTLNADGSFSYTPNEDFSGTDSFAYRASDGELTSVATVTITVASACGGRTPTLVGTAGNDKLIGTTGDDVIWALGGNDKILAQGGNDVICGGSGNDELNADSGNDHLYGGSGEDILRGDVDNDAMDGGTETDTCFGDRGMDTATNCERVTGVP